MARLLAFDWDQQEVRYVVVNTRGTKLIVEAAASVAIEGSANNAESRLALRAALQTALAPFRAGRAKTFVAIERSQIELVSLTLPPSSDAELPELVRHQAMREASTISEDSALDFVPLTAGADEPRKVIAVALSQARLEEIQAACTEAGVTPNVIGLRPYGAAALLTSALAGQDGSADGQAALLVNVFAEEIDLAVVFRGQVVFWRTLRQAKVSHDPAAAKKLIAELSRTLVVAQGQVDGAEIEAVYLLGSLAEHPVLLEQMQSELSLPVTLVDPFAALPEATEDVPENPGRFGALLGMLSVEAQSGAQAIDFLHPRKQPKPPNRRRMFSMAGGAAGLLVLLLGYQVWSTFAELDAQNESLTAELDRLDDQFKRAGKQQKVIQAIHEWQEGDVNWLDELRDLSLRLPSGRDAVVLRMGLGHARGVGGTIDIVGVVRDPAIVSRIENDLRDKFHQISSRRVQEREQENSYSWHFESSLIVSPRDKKQYVSHLPKAVEADDAPAATPATSSSRTQPSQPPTETR